jgi:hypothetical protein
MLQLNFAKKKTEIFVPQQWATVIRMPRRNRPYVKCGIVACEVVSRQIVAT